jgi:hypothetical protein
MLLLIRKLPALEDRINRVPFSHVTKKPNAKPLMLAISFDSEADLEGTILSGSKSAKLF